MLHRVRGNVPGDTESAAVDNAAGAICSNGGKFGNGYFDDQQQFVDEWDGCGEPERHGPLRTHSVARARESDVQPSTHPYDKRRSNHQCLQ